MDVFVDNTMAEAFWMGGRVAMTLATPSSGGRDDVSVAASQPARDHCLGHGMGRELYLGLAGDGEGDATARLRRPAGHSAEHLISTWRSRSAPRGNAVPWTSRLFVTLRARLCGTGGLRPVCLSHPPSLVCFWVRLGFWCVIPPPMSGVLSRFRGHKVALRLPYC